MTNNNLAYVDKKAWSELVRKLHNYDDLLVFNLLVILLAEYHSTSKLDIKINKQDLRDRLDIKDHNLINRIYKACAILKSAVIRFEDDEIVEPIALIESCPFKKKDFSLYIKIDKRFEPFLKELETFIKMRQSIARCKPSAVLLYSLLKMRYDHKYNPIDWRVVNEYCHLDYKNYPGFKQRFLDPTIKSIKDLTEIDISYSEVKHGKKVIGLKFNLIDSVEPKKPDITDLLPESEPELEPEPINHIPETRKTIKKPFEAEIKEVYDHYMTVFHRDNRYTLTADRQAVIRARLEEKYTVEELKKHIDLHKKSDFHNGVNDQKKFYIDLKEHIFNKTKFDTRQQNIEASKPKAKDVYVKPIYSDSIPENTNEQIIDSIDFIFFVEKYYINDHNSAYRNHRKTAETFPEFWLRTMSLRR